MNLDIDELQSMNITELRNMAKKKKCKNVSKLDRTKLINYLQNSDILCENKIKRKKNSDKDNTMTIKDKNKRKKVNFDDDIIRIVNSKNLCITDEGIRYLNNFINIVVKKFIYYDISKKKYDSKNFFRILQSIFHEIDCIDENTTKLSRCAYQAGNMLVDIMDCENLDISLLDISVCLVEELFINQRVKVNKKILYFITGLLGYLVIELLTLIIDRDEICECITVEDIKTVIREDEEFKEFFNKNKINY